MDTAAVLCITVVVGDGGACLTGRRDSLLRLRCLRLRCASIGTGMLCGMRTEHWWGRCVSASQPHSSPFKFMGGDILSPYPSIGTLRFPIPLSSVDEQYQLIYTISHEHEKRPLHERGYIRFLSTREGCGDASVPILPAHARKH